MNAGGSCEKCWHLSFFGCFWLDLSPWGYRNRCFPVAMCHLIVMRPNLEVATKRLLHQQLKITGQFYCHVCNCKCIPTAISGCVDISEVPGCYLIRQMSSQWGLQKLLQGLMFHEITAYLFIFNQFKINEWIMAIYQKHINQIILNRTTL